MGPGCHGKRKIPELCAAAAVPLEHVYSLPGLLRRGSCLFGYITPDLFVLKIHFITLVSYLMFSLEHSPPILFERVGGRDCEGREKCSTEIS